MDREGEGEGDYSQKRKRLYHIAYDQCAKQYINYHKFYTASKAMDYWSTALKYITAGIGAILLALLSQQWSTPELNEFGAIVLILSLLVSGLALVKSLENWETKSHIYHNYGQRHQELFEEFRKLVILEMPDMEESYSRLEEETYSLLDEKQNLNKLTPQISSVWYRMLLRKVDLNRDPISLEDVRDGEWNLRERDD